MRQKCSSNSGEMDDQFYTASLYMIDMQHSATFHLHVHCLALESLNITIDAKTKWPEVLELILQKIKQVDVPAGCENSGFSTHP